MDGTCRTHRTDTISRDISITAQHVDIISQRLEVIGRVIPTDVSLVVQVGHLGVGSLG